MENIIGFSDLPQEIQNYIQSEYELYEDECDVDFDEYVDEVNYYFINGKYYQEYHDEYLCQVWVDSHFEDVSDWDHWIFKIKNNS